MRSRNAVLASIDVSQRDNASFVDLRVAEELQIKSLDWALQVVMLWGAIGVVCMFVAWRFATGWAAAYDKEHETLGGGGEQFALSAVDVSGAVSLADEPSSADQQAPDRRQPCHGRGGQRGPLIFCCGRRIYMPPVCELDARCKVCSVLLKKGFLLLATMYQAPRSDPNS
jgi:hypothetical protein